MIKEVNRGEGMTQLIEWPDQMEIKRIYVRKKHKVEESPIDDFLFILGMFLFVMTFVFAVPLVQTSELLFLLLFLASTACLMTIAFREGKKRGR